MSKQQIIKNLQDQGLNLIPLKEKSKIPSIEWKIYQVEKYNNIIPISSNYAIICGYNNLVVIDIDNCNDLDFLNKIIPNVLNKTLVVKTGKGFHIYIKVKKLPNSVVLENGKLHIDIQSNGKYVVGPECLHPNGSIYKVISNTNTIGLFDFQEVIVNLEKLNLKPNRSEVKELAKGGIEEGNRHESALKYANHLLFKADLDKETVRLELKRWNQTNSKPLPDTELNQIIEDAINYHDKNKAKTGTIEYHIGKKTTKIKILDHDIVRLRPQCEIENVFYYRVDLPTEKIIESDKGIETLQVLEPFFITSNRELIHSENPTLKEKFSMPLMIKSMSAKWNYNDVIDFVEKKSDIDILDVYFSTEKMIRRYLDLTNDGYYAVLTLWVIGTYVSKIFAYYPYLDFFGTKGSAKSKSLNLLEQLAFNAQMFNSISGASAYRIIEGTGCSLMLDETEYLKDPKSEKAQFILNLLKGAFKTDSKSLVSIPTSDGWIPWPFDSGSCIAMGHIKGLDDVLEDRNIPIPMLITLNKKISNVEINPNNPEWEKLRAKYYRLILNHFKEIKKCKEIPYNNQTISNRELNQIWKPIITLARFFELNGVKDLVRSLQIPIKQTHERKIVSNQSSNMDIQILEGLVTMIEKKELTYETELKQKNWYKQKEVFEKLKLVDGLEWLDSNQAVGSSCTRLGFPRKKYGNVGMCVFIDNKILSTTCKRHNVDFEEKQQKIQ